MHLKVTQLDVHMGPFLRIWSHMCIRTYTIIKLSIFIKDAICFLQNAILVVLFGLSFLSGGIANVVYAADNGELHTDLCFFGSSGTEFCANLERVVATEGVSGVSWLSSQSLARYCVHWIMCHNLNFI